MARLKAFFANKTLPEKEKSYLSQLMHGAASFGEKAARRLEGTYGMGDGYLDRQIDESKDVAGDPRVRSKSSGKSRASALNDAEIALLAAYQIGRAHV